MAINRRVLLKGFLALPVISIPGLSFGSTRDWTKQPPTTPEGLYAAINSICDCVGHSMTAYVNYGGNEYIPYTYALGREQSRPKDKKALVRAFWSTAVQMSDAVWYAGRKPIVVWRVKPHFSYSHGQEGNVVLRMRIYIGDVDQRVDPLRRSPLAYCEEGLPVSTIVAEKRACYA